MRTYKEPKRIDKARSHEPGLVNIDEGISKYSALSAQVEEENMENSSDKEEEEMLDDDFDSGVQENHIDDREEDLENNEEKMETRKQDCKGVNHEVVNSETSVKKKIPTKKSKKITENNLDNSDEMKDVDVEKNKPEIEVKSKKSNIAKVPKKRKLVNEKKDKNLATKGLNNCVVDLGSKEKVSPKDKTKVKEKISPKSKAKLKVAKSKQKTVPLDDIDDVEMHKVDSDKSSLNTSDSLTVSPRSSKRTPVKNRKYQSDEELEISKEETDSSGKKKRSRSKSPRCSTPKRRKLDFDENEFMNMKDEDLEIEKDLESIPNESTSSNSKKVVKSPKNKTVGKADLILKPKPVKKKNKVCQNEKNESNKFCQNEKNESNKLGDENNDLEKSNEDNMQVEESSDKKEASSVEEKKKKVKKKKSVTKKDTCENAASTIDDTLEEVINRFKSADDLLSDEENVSKTENDAGNKGNDKNKNTEVQMDSVKNDTPEDSEKGEKKEKRKMKPLEEIVCTYCKKVSIGKAANTRHLKKCYVYQAKLEMQKEANENGDVTKIYTQDVSDLTENKPDNKSFDAEMNNESNKQDTGDKKDNLNESEQTNEEIQNEDKENLNESFGKENESASSENKSDINQSPSRKKSKSDVIYNCQHCDYSANKRAMLARHLHSHSIFMCLRCSFFCESDDDLKDHMHREHKDRMDHKLCRKCSRYVHCVGITLEQHMDNCQGPVPFKCPHCEKEFKYESSLKSHVVKHDPDGPKKFSCPQCTYKSNYKANLKKHLANIHSSRIKQFKCTYENCEKMFHSEDNMRRHLKWHRIEKPYKCEQCGKEFRTQSALTGHNEVHKSTKPFKCTMEECEKAFRSQKLLKNHLQEYHNQAEKKFTCQHPGCDFAFFKRSHLDRHLVTHSGVRKYGCTYCGKGFRHADNLRVHLRQHTNEKPVSCNMCDNKFRQKSSLRYHLQKVHDVVFKKREKRTSESVPNNGMLKAENDNVNQDTSMEMITAIVNAVAKCDDSNASLNDEVNKNSETVGANDITKADSAVTNKVVDLYEFKSDDEFGDDSMLVPLPLPIQRSKNHVTPTKHVEKVETKVEDKPAPTKHDDTKEDEPTDTELNEIAEKIEKPKPKTVRRGKKKKINYAEPETDISFETIETKEENKEQSDEKKPVVKQKRGPRKSKLNAAKKMEETKEKKEAENTEVKPRGRRGRKKIEKIPKKRGRKPKNLMAEENLKKSPPKSPPKKKKAGRPRKIRPPPESEDEKKDDNNDEVSDQEGNDTDKDEDRTIPGARDEDEDTVDNVDNAAISPPSDDDDDTREYIGDEALKENIPDVTIQEKEKSDEEVEEEIKKEEESKPENVENVENVEKQSEMESDKMSSGIDTDFEDDLKPPPAPRPPPVVDSDEGDIESGPEDMDTPGRDFESTPPKSNITEHIHSVPAHTPRDFESSPPKSVQTSDYGPSAHSQTGFETRREGDSVEALSGSYSVTPSREVSVEEKGDERDLSLPYSHIESENLPTAQHSPIMESIQQGPQSNGNNDYGSQSESTMPEVDKEYLGQYLQQFDSASRSEDDRIERMNSQNEPSSEPLNLPTSPQKDLPPLNLSANAPPLNLSTSSNDRENSQGSDMSNKRMEILSMDRQSEDHYSGRSENVSRSSDRIPDNVYESISSMNTFMPATTREGPVIHSAESSFPSVSTPSTFMRFSENEALLQRQRMTTPFLPQGDPNALQNLHRMADNALAQHNNASLLRRPTTVPPREDMFSSTSAAMAQTIARNPFHNSWTSQDVRPAHWGQSPYLGRTIDRPSAATSTSLFGKDNYLPGREFMFDTSRRAVTDRTVFPGLPQTQRPEIGHDAFERFDIGSYFGGHTYPGTTSLSDYNRAAAAHTSQKTFDERYRQSSTGITDFRALPQTTASSMFTSNMLNSSFHLDKYMYSRDPVYHAQHIPDAANSPFLPGVPGQHSVFDRDYTRGYFQNSPYSLDKQYAAAAAASAKLSHPSGASVVQDRDFVPRPGTAAATGDNQVQDAYRHPMLYNMMNHRFYE